MKSAGLRGRIVFQSFALGDDGAQLIERASFSFGFEKKRNNWKRDWMSSTETMLCVFTPLLFNALINRRKQKQ